MRLLPALRRKQELVRDQIPLAFNDYLSLFSSFGFNGLQYTMAGQSQEQIAPLYARMAQLAYKQNSVVFACMAARQLLLSEARFCFRERRNGRPGNLFTTADLAPLETPWPGATTGDLISVMELHDSLGGNWFGTNRYGGVRSLRPDYMTILLGSENDYLDAWDPEAVVIGYLYKHPITGERTAFLPDEVAHYFTYPDPEARYRGMSWLTPVVREVMADKAATDHKLAFFENGATPNLVVKMDVEDLNQWVVWIKKFMEDHDGVGNAYKTMFLGAGMDATVVGKDLGQMDFKATQGAGETRIVVAARVPASVAQISEGLAGSALNAGNFESSMRLFADMMARPAWRKMAGSLQTLVPPPNPGSELWYDDRDIPALREDIRKRGELMTSQATAISTLKIAGYMPDSVVDAVVSEDMSRLVPDPNAGPSVQVQSQNPPAPATDGQNGRRSDDLLGALLARPERALEFHAHMPELPAVTVPVTVEAAEPSHLTFEAARAPDVHLNVEPPRVEFADGAFRVESPVTVEAAEPQHITVEAARAPDVHVDIAPAEVRVEAPQITVEASPTPDVHVDIAAPPPAEVSVSVAPELRAELVLDEQAAEALRQQPSVTVENIVNPTPVTVENTVNVPETPVNVNLPPEQPDGPKHVSFKRNPDGTIKSAEVTDA